MMQQLLRDRAREALSDSKRAKILRPEWPKGHYRHAQSLYEMNMKDKAVEENQKALKMCKELGVPENDIKDLEGQREKFMNPSLDARDEVKREQSESESDVPDLTDPSSGDESSSDTDTDELPPDLVSLSSSDGSVSEGSVADDEHSDVPPDLVSEEDDDPETKEYIETVKKRCRDFKNPARKDVSQSSLDEDKAKREEERLKKEKKKKKKEEEQKRKEESRRRKRTRRGDKFKAENQDKTNQALEPPPKSPEEIRREDFQFRQKEGTTALMDERSRHALRDFQKCLEMVHDFGSKTFLLEEIDLALLKYGYATACIETGTYKEILEGMEMLTSILKDHPGCRFVLAYHGLGKAYIKLNRYREALEPLGKGLEMSKKFPMQNLTWPGTHLKIRISNNINIQRELENLIQLSRSPPQPDAVCRYKNCEDHKIQIYFSDPDFKGYVRAICLDKCQTDFHINCWKCLKTDLGQSDKDFMKMPCFTPDCEGMLIEVHFFDEDGLEKKKLVLEEEDLIKMKENRQGGKKKSTVPAAPVPQLSSSSNQEITGKKKQSKKELRKQKKQELRKKPDEVQEEGSKIATGKEVKDVTTEVSILEELDVLERKAENKDSKASSTNSTPREEEQRKLDFAGKLPDLGAGDVTVTMLKKEEEVATEVITYKAFKQQKHKQKKKKEKKVMTLDEFRETATTATMDVPDSDVDGAVDRLMAVKSITTGGLEDIDDFDVGSETSSMYSETMDTDKPFQPPEHLREQIEAFESSRSKVKYTSAAEAVKANMTSAVQWRSPEEESVPTELVPIRDFMYSFFEEILKVSGPLHIEDERITGEIRNFPDEALSLIKKAGGKLRDFMLKNLKFAVIGDYVCLMKDAVRAKEMWERDRMNLGLSVGINSMRGSLAELAQSALKNVSPSTRSADTGQFQRGELTDFSSADFPQLSDVNSADISDTNVVVQNVGKDAGLSVSLSSIAGSVVTSEGDNWSGKNSGRNSPAIISAGKNVNSTSRRGSFKNIESESDTRKNGNEEQNLNLTIKKDENIKQNFQPNENMQGQGGQNRPQNGKSTEAGVELSNIADEFRRKVHNLVGELRVKEASESQPSPSSTDIDAKDSGVQKPAFITEMKISDAENRSRSLSPSVLKHGTKTSDREIGISISNKAKNVNISQKGKTGNSDGSRSLTPVGSTLKTAPQVPVSGHSSSLPTTPCPTTGWPNSLDGVPLEATNLKNAGHLERIQSPGLKIKPIGSEKKLKQSSQESGTFQKVVGSLNTGGRSAAEVGHSPENPGFHVTTPGFSGFPSFQSHHGIDSPRLFLPSESGRGESLERNRSGGGIGPPQNGNMMKCKDSEGKIHQSPVGGSPRFDADALKMVNSIIDDDGNEDWSKPQENRPLAKYTRNVKLEPPISFPIATQPQGGYMRPPAMYSPNHSMATIRSVANSGGSTVAVLPERTLKEALVQTEPWEELENLKTDHSLLEASCQELKDRYKQLQNSSSAEMNSMRDTLDVYKEKMKKMNDENKKIQKTQESETKKWAQEKRGHLEELKSLKQQISTLKVAEKEHLEKLVAKDGEIESLYMQINSDRERTNTDRCKTQEHLEALSLQTNMERNRAQQAEVQVLRLKLEVGTDILNSSLREAQRYLAYLGKGIMKLQDDHHPVPPPLQSSYDQWDLRVKKLQELLTQSKSDFEEQIKMVENGRELSSLVELPIPKPPPAPAGIPGISGPPSLFPPGINPQRSVPRSQTPGFQALGGATAATTAAAPRPSPAPVFAPPPMNSASLGSFPQQQQLPPSGVMSPPNLPPSLPVVRPTPQMLHTVPPGVTAPPQPVAPQPPIGSGTPRNSFEKIMMTLTSMFPQVTRSEITQKIQDLRESRGGSLSGMALEEIIHNTASMILQTQGKPMANQTSRPVLPPGFSYGNHGNGVSSVPRLSPSGTSQEVFEEEVDPCIICHEELTKETTARLDCKHRFHRVCISTWFREQSTCPTCRVHALLPEDFPNLK